MSIKALEFFKDFIVPGHFASISALYSSESEKVKDVSYINTAQIFAPNDL